MKAKVEHRKSRIATITKHREKCEQERKEHVNQPLKDEKCKVHNNECNGNVQQCKTKAKQTQTEKGKKRFDSLIFWQDGLEMYVRNAIEYRDAL